MASFITVQLKTKHCASANLAKVMDQPKTTALSNSPM